MAIVAQWLEHWIVDPRVAGSNPVDRPCPFLFNRLTMTLFEALILGILQGLTEFLPVSSSAHLELGQIFFGMKDLHQYILFDLICHLGTLFAIFFILFPSIKEALFNPQTLKMITWGTLPLFPLIFLLKPIESIFNSPSYLGWFFLVTALLLLLGEKYGQTKQSPMRWQDSLLIGMFQAVAIIPGISRSGATISAARMVGWERQKAVIFSFLLAIPAILGGVAIKFIQLIKNNSLNAAPVSIETYFVAFLSSFLVGCLALHLLLKIVLTDKLQFFAWYCLLLGFTCILLF